MFPSHLGSHTSPESEVPNPHRSSVVTGVTHVTVTVALAFSPDCVSALFCISFSETFLMLGSRCTSRGNEVRFGFR